MAAPNGKSTEKQRGYYHKYYITHRETALERSKKARREIRDAAIKAYGGYSCTCQHEDGLCRESTPQYLSIDHINGGGNKHRKKVGGGAPFFLWLKQNDYPTGYRVLCYNCNLSSGFYGQCPKERMG